jgi:NADH-quinone oxidoreductase subunit H
MLGVGLAFVWTAFVALAWVGCATIERRGRLRERPDRPELAPLKAVWGSGFERPPSVHLGARALAEAARLVRSTSSVVDRATTLRRCAQVVSCASLASALALVPFAGTWGGGAEGRPLVTLDLRNGLAALVFLLLLANMAQVAVGLADRSAWSRLGSVRLASRSLGGVGLLLLVLAPLPLATGSLRLHDLVMAQQGSFAPLSWLSSPVGAQFLDVVQGWRFPDWNLFAQPLTALLFVPVLAGLTRRPWIHDTTAGSMATIGFGLDSDPIDLHWSQFEARLARILAAALFVALFLGGGGIPFVAPSMLVDRLAPFVGTGLPSLLGVMVELGVFFAKWMLVFAIASGLRRATAIVREDQWLAILTRRLFPLAWANLLLMSAITLLSDSIRVDG